MQSERGPRPDFWNTPIGAVTLALSSFAALGAVTAFWTLCRAIGTGLPFD